MPTNSGSRVKELLDLSDPQTAEALKYDIRWKVACGRALTETSFDPSTLVYWRRRIAESERPDRVFEAVDAVIAETGVLRGKRKRCVDSTVFDDAVATQDTVTQLVAAMRKVARLVPGAQEVVARVAGLDYSKPGKPQIDWDDPDAKQQLVSDLVNDALAVLAELTSPDAPEREDKAADALGLLALVAGQDVEPAEDSDGTDGRWRIVRRVAPDRVISVVDTETRHTRTSKANRKDGFRGHIAAEPSTGLITDCALTKASGEQGSDATVGEKMIARDRYHRADTGAVGDGADPAAPADEDPGVGGAGAAQPDTTAPMRAEQEQSASVGAAIAAVATGDDAAAGRRRGLRGVRRLGLRHRRGARRLRRGRARHRDQAKPLLPAVPGGFTLDDFAIDEQAGTVTCPGGHTRTMSPKRTVTFGAVCADCPLRARCTTAKDGRSMSIHEHEALLRAARAQARTPEFKQAYPTRSTVERIVGWTATSRGRRIKLRYLGVEKNHAWLRIRCAAINLRTLINSGLARTDGAWALA